MRKILPKRKKIRLSDYDYLQENMYFITICVRDRLELLGKIGKEYLKIKEYIKNNVLNWPKDKYFVDCFLRRCLMWDTSRFL